MNEKRKPEGTEYIPPGKRARVPIEPPEIAAAALLALPEQIAGLASIVADLSEMVEDLAEGQATIAEYLKELAEDRGDRKEMKDVEQAALKIAEDAETLREDLADE
jgi:hypothetical protein